MYTIITDYKSLKRDLEANIENFIDDVKATLSSLDIVDDQDRKALFVQCDYQDLDVYIDDLVEELRNDITKEYMLGAEDCEDYDERYNGFYLEITSYHIFAKFRGISREKVLGYVYNKNGIEASLLGFEDLNDIHHIQIDLYFSGAKYNPIPLKFKLLPLMETSYEIKARHKRMGIEEDEEDED